MMTSFDAILIPFAPIPTPIAGFAEPAETDGMHKADIQAAIKKKGKTLTQVATAAGLGRAACRNALCRKHVRGEKAIAAELGLPLWELWPDRWEKAPDGSAARIDLRRTRSVYETHNTGRRRAGHRQKSEAA